MINCLLIDRDSAVRSRVKDMLIELGITCHDCEGWPAAKIIPRNQYALVIVGNPGPEEYKFIPGVRGPWRHTVLFYFSTHPDVDVIGQFICNGVSDVLVLPFDSKILGFKLAQCGIALHSDAA
jgi:DNA-binding NtrC family response regulator